MTKGELRREFERLRRRDKRIYGGEAMHEYKFSDDSFDASPEKELVDLVSNVDKKYRINLDYDSNKNDLTLNLEKRSIKEKTIDEIESEAKNSLASFKDKSLKDIENDFSSGLNNLELKSEKEIKTLEDAKESAKKLYDEKKETTKNSLLRRGLARSSILISSEDAFSNEELKLIDEIDQKISKNLETLEEKKSLLEVEKENALESFDISYAVKLSEKIAMVNETLEKQKAEVVKYNNSIREKEATFQKNQIDQNIKEDAAQIDKNEFIQGLISKFGTVGVERLKNQEKTELVKNYLSSFSPSDAVALLETSPSLKEKLGQNAYSSVLAWAKDRIA